MLGDYQKKNVKTAVSVIRKLENFKVDNNQIEKGLLKVAKSTGLKGRWQILQESPKIICDTAHNKDGLLLTMNQLKKENYHNLHIVLGVVSDKKLENVLDLFPKNAHYYFCQPNIPRALNVSDLQEKAKEFKLFGQKYNSVNEAYNSAKVKAEKKDIIYIGGSTFVVAEIL